MADLSSYASALMGSDPASALGSLFTPNYVNPQYATPQQATQLRLYGNALLKPPTSIHRPTQGIAQMVNALMGGNALYQADHMDQGAMQAGLGATARYAAQQPAFATPSASGSVPAPTPSSTPVMPPPQSGPAGASSQSAGPDDVSSYVASAAAQRGIDPATALKVFGAESSLDPNATGDNGTSGGVAQLHVGGGMGDDYRSQVDPNFDPKNPSANWQKQVDFALDQAKQGGWSPWHAAAKVGVGDMDGIGAVPPSASALSAPQPTQASAPAMQAINAVAPQGGQLGALPPNASALSATVGTLPRIPVGPAPQMTGQAPQNQMAGGYTPQDYALIQNSPYVGQGVKDAAAASLTPKIIQDANGNSYAMYPGHNPIPLNTMAPKVVPSDVSTPGGVHATGMTPVGTGAQPVGPTTLAIPHAGGAGQGGSAADPLAGLAPLANSGANIGAHAAAIGTMGAAGATQYANDRAASANYARTIQPLTQAIPALEALGKTGTGPGTDQRNQIVSFLQSLGIPGFDGSKIQNFDEAKKYLTDYVRQSGGTGTNDQLAASFAGNPSVDISNAAAADVAKSALALQRMKQAQVLSADPNKPESYGQHASQFANSQDVRAYGVDLMTPQARAKLDASLPAGSPERARFLSSYRLAKQTGVLQPLNPTMGTP